MPNYTKYASNVPKTSIRVFGICPDNYYSHVTQIQEMAAIAKKYFPDLEDCDIIVVTYSGDRWKNQTGIEWYRDTQTPIPVGFSHFDRLEPTFSGN